MVDKAQVEAMELSRLEGMMRELADARAQLVRDIRTVAAALDAKRIKEAVRQDIEAIGRKHKVQIVNPDGIPTSEGFGVVGGVAKD